MPELTYALLADQVAKLCYYYRRHNIKYPDYVYVGHAEFHIIATSGYLTQTIDQVMQYQGMRVIRVMADHHCAVGGIHDA